MNNHFDTVEYIKLLEKENILATKGSSLYSENEEENSKLRSYRITLEDQIYSNNRYEYQFLIKGYILEKMSTLTFISVFLKLFRIDRDRLEPIEKNLKRLSTFSIDSKYKNFATFISEIFEDCDYSFDENCKVTEEESKDSIKKKVFSDAKIFLN
ncbi:MAG: hypothetical protein QNK20_14550 [Aureibaculum sp.]|nr:hypothetical protein [Aureibaculum sp.]